MKRKLALVFGIVLVLQALPLLACTVDGGFLQRLLPTALADMTYQSFWWSPGDYNWEYLSTSNSLQLEKETTIRFSFQGLVTEEDAAHTITQGDDEVALDYVRFVFGNQDTGDTLIDVRQDLWKEMTLQPGNYYVYQEGGSSNVYLEVFVFDPVEERYAWDPAETEYQEDLKRWPIRFDDDMKVTFTFTSTASEADAAHDEECEWWSFDDEYASFGNARFWFWPAGNSHTSLQSESVESDDYILFGAGQRTIVAYVEKGNYNLHLGLGPCEVEIEAVPYHPMTMTSGENGSVITFPYNPDEFDPPLEYLEQTGVLEQSGTFQVTLDVAEDEDIEFSIDQNGYGCSYYRAPEDPVLIKKGEYSITIYGSAPATVTLTQVSSADDPGHIDESGKNFGWEDTIEGSEETTKEYYYIFDYPTIVSFDVTNLTPDAGEDDPSAVAVLLSLGYGDEWWDEYEYTAEGYQGKYTDSISLSESQVLRARVTGVQYHVEINCRVLPSPKDYYVGLMVGETFAPELQYLDNEKLIWSSEEPTAVSVDENGVLRAIKDYSNVHIYYKVKDPADAENLTAIRNSRPQILYVDVYEGLSKTKASLGVGGTVDLTTDRLSEFYWDALWSSSDPSVASVENGVVTARKEGSAVITCKVSEGEGWRELTAAITVKAPALAKTSATIEKGKTVTLKVNYAGSQAVTWSSSNKAVATVTSKGVVKGVKAGTATITAKVGGKSLKATVTVSAPSLSVTKATIDAGKSITLTVKSAGSDKITWSSSNKAVATVTSKGVVKGLKAGKATITAKVAGKSLKATITVKGPYLSATTAKLAKGNSITLKVNGAPGAKVTWSSSNKKIATVTSKGIVKGVKAGKATITAKVAGKTLKATVTVIAKPTLSATKLTLNAGKTAALKVTGTGSTKVTWSSSNKAVATVSSSGVVSGIKAGKATITAKIGTVKITCAVTVKPVIIASPASLTMQPDSSAFLTLTVKGSDMWPGVWNGYESWDFVGIDDMDSEWETHTYTYLITAVEAGSGEIMCLLEDYDEDKDEWVTYATTMVKVTVQE